MTVVNNGFSYETRGLALRKIILMRSLAIFTSFAVTVAIAAMVSPVSAANSPLDFSYKVIGAPVLRPLLVFNDGADTFIQPQDPIDKTMLVNGAPPVRQGPYFVVRGVGAEITLTLGNKASARISYTKPVVLAPHPVAIPDSKSKVKSIRAETKNTDDTDSNAKFVQKTSTCQPHREQRSSAFVATFKPEASVLSDLAKAEVYKFVGDTNSIAGVDVIAEGAKKVLGQKRAEAIKSVLVGTGIDAGKISLDVRASTGIGSEIHIYRITEIPCGSTLVRMPARRGPVSIIWDRDAKELAERIASELKVKFTVKGNVRSLPVRLAMVETPFGDAMQQVGQALGEEADLILRVNELVLSFKEKR